MAIKKIALVDSEVNESSIWPLEKITADEAISARFQKIANELRLEQQRVGGKQLSPKVDDFLYAHCVMMHAAEAALINQETGEPLLNKAGKPVQGAFFAVKDSKGKESVRWESPDGIKNYKNANGDIFPEEDLLKAHKDWVGKPLCKDHVSSSVDGIRGIIVDTFYDPKFKRVHALFALDRKNYGELARKVEAGYATAVSMGTAVGRSICTECANVATVESEYCHHVKTKSAYGEVNKDLSPIELSLVVTGADPKAKIKTVLAHLNRYREQAAKANPAELAEIETGLGLIQAELEDTGALGPLDAEPETPLAGAPDADTADEDGAVDEILEALSLLKNRDLSGETRALGKQLIDKKLTQLGKSLDELTPDNRKRLLQAAHSAHVNLGEAGDEAVEKTLKGLLEEGGEPPSAADVRPGMVSREGPVKNELIDSNGYGLAANDFGSGQQFQSPNHLMSSLKPKQVKTSKIEAVLASIAKLEAQLKSENINMTLSDLKRELNRRKAYWQGTEEPTPGTPQYPLMGDQDGIREKEDRQMLQTGDLGGEDGMVPADEKLKPMIQRAELERRMARRTQLLSSITKDAGDDEVPAQLKKGKVEIIETKDGKKKAIDSATGAMMAKDKKESKESKESKAKKSKESKESKESKASKKKAKAYWQGTEEPTPGKPQYPLMGDQDGIREKEDRQMLQTGNMGGDDGMVPGDEKPKRTQQRMASVTGALFKGASPAKSRWEFSLGGKKVLAFTAKDVFGDLLNKPLKGFDMTASQFFHSKDYGNQVRSRIKEFGLDKTAALLGIPLVRKAAEGPGALPPPPGPGGPGGGDDKASKAPPDKGSGPAAGGGDDLKKEIAPLIEKIEVTLDDIKSKVSGGEEGLEDLSVETKKPETVAPPEPGAEPDLGGLPPPPKAAAVQDKDMLAAYALLSDMANELCYLQDTASKKASKNFVQVARQAIRDAKTALKEVEVSLTVYASQKRANLLAKRAERRAQIVAKATGMGMGMEPGHEDLNQDSGWMYAKDKHSKKSKESKESKHSKKSEEDDAMYAHDMFAKDKHSKKSKESAESKHSKKSKESEDDAMYVRDEQCAKDKKSKDSKESKESKHSKRSKHSDDAQDGMVADPDNVLYVLDPEEKEEAHHIAEEEVGEHEEHMHHGEHGHPGGVSLDLAYDGDPTHKAARQNWREELVKAAKGGKWNTVYEEERSKGGPTLDFEMKIPDDLAKVETLHEVHEALEDVATKPLSKVREAAEKLNRWIKSGGISADKLDALVAEGAIDGEAAKYWKQFYGQVDGGKEFADGLVKEFSKKAAAANEQREVRIRRAYDLGMEAQKKGIIARSQAELNKYVDTLINIPEEMFNSLKSHVQLLKVPQHLTAAPLVGLNNSEEPVQKTASLADPTFENLKNLFG